MWTDFCADMFSVVSRNSISSSCGGYVHFWGSSRLYLQSSGMILQPHQECVKRLIPHPCQHLLFLLVVRCFLILLQQKLLLRGYSNLNGKPIYGSVNESAVQEELIWVLRSSCSWFRWQSRLLVPMVKFGWLMLINLINCINGFKQTNKQQNTQDHLSRCRRCLWQQQPYMCSLWGSVLLGCKEKERITI